VHPSVKHRARRAGWLLVAGALAACSGQDTTELLPELQETMAQDELEPDPLESVLTRDAGLEDVLVDAAAPPSRGDAGNAESLPPLPMDAGLVPPAVVAMPEQPPPRPPELCSRLDPDPVFAGQALLVVVDDYLIRQHESCETALLLADASEDVLIAWFTYLYDYSYALLGCELAIPPAGGLEVFALANTAVAGVEIPPPRLGQDDAEHLIRQYLDALGSWLAFEAGEREAFEAYLRWQAGKVVDPESSSALSNCGTASP
jgi:hypothetical protein